jgi:hypothetical protein
MICYHADTKELRELPDALLADWAAVGNPKLGLWLPAPEKPSDDAEWVGGAWFVPPAAPAVPSTVSARQIRLWLVRNGISLDSVSAAIANIADPLTRESVGIEWEYAPYIERAHPMLLPLAEVLGLTSEQLDAAFVEAAGI